MKIDINNFDNNTLANEAYNTILNTESSIFLTGKAGTGKSTLLKCILANTNKNYAVLAPTGVAAKNIDGVTIHSFFKIPYNLIETNFQSIKQISYNYNQTNIIKKLELLVIDEISMVNVVLLDCVNKLLQRIRNSFKPFGGVQLLLLGDPFQLPPVIKNNELKLIHEYWSSIYFFDAKCFKNSISKTIELKHCYRQKDSYFMNILDSIRLNNLTVDALNDLNKFCLYNVRNVNAVTITTLNDTANKINEKKLAEIEGEKFIYPSEIAGNFNLKECPAEIELHLKKGARIMFIKNNLNAGYCNGTMGTIEFLNENTIGVMTDENILITVEKAEWLEYEFKTDANGCFKKEATGLFIQYPIKLAWAITVNKSQGLTFNSVHLDFQSGAFFHGQTYVALSRCRSLEGLSYDSPIYKNDIKIDPRVLDFYTKNLF